MTRALANLMAVLVIAAIIVLAVAVSGCAGLQREREMRYMPEATNPPATRSIFVDEYEAAKAAAISNPSRATILRMVDSGSALSAISCGSWMRRDVLAAQGIVMRDSTLSAVDAASTIAAGAFKLSPGGVAAVGGLQMIGHLVGQVEKSGLGAPDTFQAQATMRGTLAKCSADLVGKAKTGDLSLASAVIGIDACEWLCTPGAAAAISTQALAATEVVVQPGGGVSVVAVGSTFVKDDSGARIVAWWMPNGSVDPARDAALKAWQAKNGVQVSIPFMAHSKLYEAARKQAVVDLSIPGAP